MFTHCERCKTISKMVSKNKRLDVKVQEFVGVAGDVKHITNRYRHIGDMRERKQGSCRENERFMISDDSSRQQRNQVIVVAGWNGQRAKMNFRFIRFHLHSAL